MCLSFFFPHHAKDIGEVHHELELAVVINKTCSKLESEDDWEDYVAGYGRCRDCSRHSKHTPLIPRCLAYYGRRDAFCCVAALERGVASHDTVKSARRSYSSPVSTCRC